MYVYYASRCEIDLFSAPLYYNVRLGSPRVPYIIFINIYILLQYIIYTTAVDIYIDKCEYVNFVCTGKNHL